MPLIGLSFLDVYASDIDFYLYFDKTRCLNEEVKHTEPSLSVSVPCLYPWSSLVDEREQVRLPCWDQGTLTEGEGSVGLSSLLG
jgi:hypothetical protein